MSEEVRGLLMKAKRFAVFLGLVVLWLSLPCFSQEQKTTKDKEAYQPTEQGGGIVYADDLGIAVSAPKGWLFDSQSGLKQKLNCVMYPVGKTWSSADEVMYVNFSKLKDGQSLEAFIEADIAPFKEKSPGLKVEKEKALKLKSGQEVQVRLFSGDQYGNYEAIAYVEAFGSVGMFVLSCRSKEGFDRRFLAFKEVVAKSAVARVVIENGKPK
jgi:hypothetical protein